MSGQGVRQMPLADRLHLLGGDPVDVAVAEMGPDIVDHLGHLLIGHHPPERGHAVHSVEQNTDWIAARLQPGIGCLMAEIGQGNQQTKPIAGHSGDSEVALYTRQADQARMPSAAMRALVAWEASNQEIRLDTNEQKSLNINFLYPALVGPAGLEPAT